MIWNYLIAASVPYFLRRFFQSSGRDTELHSLPNGMKYMEARGCKGNVNNAGIL